MIARRRLVSAIRLAALPLCAGCGRGAPAGESAASGITGDVAPEAAAPGAERGPFGGSPAARVAPPRCRAAEAVLSLRSALAGPAARSDVPPDGGADVPAGRPRPGGSEGGAIEIGDVVAEDGGHYAVSVIHPTAAGRTCAVAYVDGAAKGPARIVDLGATPGDAPPARLVQSRGTGGGSELLAGAYARLRSGAAADRELAIYRLTAAGPVERASVMQQRDDSLSFDVASSPGGAVLAVWDEVADPPRGVIRAAALAPGSTAFGPSRDVSPPDRDAEIPRLVSTASRSIVLWLAHRPEPSSDGRPDEPATEAVGEPRAYGWLEWAEIDGEGRSIGPPRSVTPATGHVSAYDAAALDDGSVLVVARDDGRSADGPGGRLLRVRITAHSVEPPVAFPVDGLGRGAPAFVDGSPLWLTWIGVRERLWLLPLDDTGAPAGPPGPEDAMNDGRPLFAARSRPGVAQQLLVAFPSRLDGQVWRFTCPPR